MGSQQKNSESSQVNPTVLAIREAHPVRQQGGLYTTDYHALYNVDSELTLTQPEIELGAIAALPQTDNPTLVSLRQAYGDALATNWLCIHLSLLNAASGASNRMDAAAMTLCAKDILTAFPYLTLGEFCVFCQRMRTLRYARKRSDYVFSSDTIMQGLWEFTKERKQELDRYEREHKPPVDMSRCVSKAEAVQTDEYKQAYEAEWKRLKGDAPMPKMSAVDTITMLAHALKPRPANMSEEEFVKKRDEQLAKIKARYGM